MHLLIYSYYISGTNDNQTCLKVSLEPQSSENVLLNVFKSIASNQIEFSNFDFVMYYIVSNIYLHFCCYFGIVDL